MIDHLIGKKVHINDIQGILQKEGDFYKVRETFYYFIGSDPIEVCKVEITFIEKMVEKVTSTTFRNIIVISGYNNTREYFKRSETKLIQSLVKEKK
jgi:hypothetical protein